MLIATQGKNIAATTRYFEDVLTQGDYYLGRDVAGTWQGLGAATLGLGTVASVSKEQFQSLLSGIHPTTGEALLQRVRKDRRPGVDLTFSVPKSVSLAWAVGDDERIIEALKQTVRETMTRDVESLMMRRVRTGDKAASKHRTPTGQLLYADFLHKTSRPVEGRPDPHLHIHAFVINWTHDGGKHYAGEFAEIIRQRPSLQAKFEARLAHRLKHQLGYDVSATHYRQGGKLKRGWEIAGIARETIEKFSRRTAQVEAEALKKGITDTAEKGRLGKLTREAKDRGTSMADLKREWNARLTRDEQVTFRQLRFARAENRTSENELAQRALQFALDHHLERQSTVERHQVVGTALEQAVSLRPEVVEQQLDRMDVIERTRTDEGAARVLVTTREVLAAEREIIGFARDGRGTRKPLSRLETKLSREWLNEQQQAAVRHVLEARDTVIAVTGGAGTGKSSLMKEAAEAIAKNGKQVFAFAPSTGAREVLEENGFRDAKTVEHLLKNTRLQEQVRDQVLWIDEAGLLDVRSMQAVFRIAKSQNARVVLSGDTRQHASPKRGDALRLLETEAGLNVARVEAIQRQKGNYRRAVDLVSRGHEVVNERTGATGLEAGFDLLDRLGKIKELSSEERHEVLANRYASETGEPPLIIAPTHAEAEQVTETIREQLREQNRLPMEERKVSVLKSLNLTAAEKGEAATYASGTDWIVQFHQNATGGIVRGERFQVLAANGEHVKIASLETDAHHVLPLEQADRFEVYGQSHIGLAVGDQVRFSLGGTALDGKRRISNGRLDTVRAIDAKGNLKLESGMTVAADYGHLDYGYVITSHASQGKDRRVAMAAMGAESLPAINAKQFYVTVSRGREDVAIYVDNKTQVRRAIARSGERLSASELVGHPRKTHTQESDRSPHRMRAVVRSVRDRFMTWWRETTLARTQSPITDLSRSMNGPFSEGSAPA